MPSNNEILNSSCAVYTYKLEEKVLLPPTCKKPLTRVLSLNIRKHCFPQCKNAAATINHYLKTNTPNDQNFAKAISNWKGTYVTNL